MPTTRLGNPQVKALKEHASIFYDALPRVETKPHQAIPRVEKHFSNQPNNTVQHCSQADHRWQRVYRYLIAKTENQLHLALCEGVLIQVRNPEQEPDLPGATRQEQEPLAPLRTLSKHPRRTTAPLETVARNLLSRQINDAKPHFFL
jgi:hypothetical protein